MFVNIVRNIYVTDQKFSQLVIAKIQILNCLVSFLIKYSFNEQILLKKTPIVIIIQVSFRCPKIAVRNYTIMKDKIPRLTFHYAHAPAIRLC